MPGPLHSAHKKYEHDCSACHRPFKKKIQNRKCVDCHDHKNIKHDIENKTGYHGRIPGIISKPCRDCHTEHKGRNSSLIIFDPGSFDHSMTDFPLQGKHSIVNCKSCHKPNNPWHKAQPDCNSCHKQDDAHKGALGKQCGICHTSNGWTRFIFNHDSTRFKLTGAHINQKCQACHPGSLYKLGKPACANCHQQDDHHQGLWGNKCNSCHVTSNWPLASFDHDRKTRFKLRSSHRQTRCEACHPNNPYKHKTPKKCVQCHRNDDGHNRLFGSKCVNCHTPTRWKDHKFDHSKTDYPLKGAHRETSCVHCHPGDLYKTKTPDKCYTCHVQHDVHNGTQGKYCEKCHNETSWLDKVLFDHQLSNFPLLGTHSTLACEECHTSNRFNRAKSSCYACHAKIDVHKRAFGKRCYACHNASDWKAWEFDHETQTDFKLEHAHKRVSCGRCHLPTGGKNTRLRGECVDCHLDDDIHDGSFGELCSRCHNSKDFREVSIQ